MIDDFEKKQIKQFLDSITKRITKNSDITKKDLDYIFNSLIEITSLPLPNEDLYEYFINIHTIELLLHNFYNKIAFKVDLHKYADFIYFNKINIPRSKYFIQFRELGPQGAYPDIELKRGNGHLLHCNGFPVLITKNSYLSEYQFTESSEFSWLTRNELKIATCIICAPEDFWPFLYFKSQVPIKIDKTVFSRVPKQLRLSFLSELQQYINNFTPVDYYPFSREPKGDIALYKFVKFKQCKANFDKLFDSFSIRNHLLMRTSFYFIKAIMLWNNRVFAEDALANVMYCLEGCLLLIQGKLHIQTNKINQDVLRKFFQDTFNNGDDLFDFIRDGYDKRVSIVHPNPRSGSQFMPCLLTDDFFDYFEICKLLLNYILIDRLYELP